MKSLNIGSRNCTGRVKMNCVLPGEPAMTLTSVPTVSVISAQSPAVKLPLMSTASAASPAPTVVSMAPAPPPTISAWTKPISFATTVGPIGNSGTAASSTTPVTVAVTVSSSLALAKTASAPTTVVTTSLPPSAAAVSVSVVDCGKFDKGDQHDSGIDVSDGQPNSAASSTRSSPSADNKLKDSETKVHTEACT